MDLARGLGLSGMVLSFLLLLRFESCFLDFLLCLDVVSFRFDLEDDWTGLDERGMTLVILVSLGCRLGSRSLRFVVPAAAPTFSASFFFDPCRLPDRSNGRFFRSALSLSRDFDRSLDLLDPLVLRCELDRRLLETLLRLAVLRLLFVLRDRDRLLFAAFPPFHSF